MTLAACRRRLAIRSVVASLLAATPVALAAGALAAAPARAATTWLCKPGLASNPCTPSLRTTIVDATGAPLRVVAVVRDRRPAIDCFYVYPTVSDQKAPQATKRIDPELRSIALYQAARYSQHCRVFAPVYRQITIQGLFSRSTVTEAMRRTAYADVLAAWREYLRRDNRGRGVVLIGHSQGTFALRRLIAEEVDPKPVVRKRLVSAILLGGNVLVKRGSDVGGDFANIRACRARAQVRCVIAFVTFNATPPPDAIFGRAGALEREFDLPVKAGSQVLCTNPAALAGGAARVSTVYPAAPFAPGTVIGGSTDAVGIPKLPVSTPWIERRGGYTARCSSAGGASVLLISGTPALRAVPTAAWGLHLVDATIALGTLVDVVGAQARAYAARR